MQPDVVLVRHGDAVQSVGSDWERSLSAIGQSEIHGLATRLVNRVSPGVIFASPLVRANQTARLLMPTWPGVVLEEWQSVTPGGDCESVAGMLAMETRRPVVVVTHQPFVSSMIEYLTGERIAMTTGAAVGIRNADMSERGGRVLWKE